MSVTIRDCLQLPSLRLGTAVAGRGGLDQKVDAISVVEFDNYADGLRRENELLLTAFYTVKDDVDAQCQALLEYKKSGDVGMVLFYMDVVLKNLDKRVLDTADSLNFPIIVMPGDNMNLRYSDVIRDVMEAVILDKKNKKPSIDTLESLIPAMLENDFTLMKIICEKQSLDLQSKNALYFIKINPAQQSSGNPLNLLSHIQKLWNENHSAIVYAVDECIVILTSHSPDQPREAIVFEELFTLLNGSDAVQNVTFFSNISPTSGCRELYKKYCDSILPASQIYPGRKFFTSVEINFAYKCYRLIHSGSDETSHYLNLLTPIRKDREEDLLLTLETYLLDADYEVKKTAERLYLHRNTIQYRLSKIKNRMGCDINKLPGSYDIYLAVSLHRILGTSGF